MDAVPREGVHDAIQVTELKEHSHPSPGSRSNRGSYLGKCFKHDGKYLGSYLGFGVHAGKFIKNSNRSVKKQPSMHIFKHGSTYNKLADHTELLVSEVYPCQKNASGGKRRTTRRR
jgi:hypothetical protein